MRPIRSALLLGLAATIAAGAALAASDAAHILTVRLPDGSVEHIRYTGDVAPRVVLVPAARLAAADPFAAIFGGASPFTMMDRISAEMNAHADAMMHEAAAMAARAPAAAGSSVHMVSGGALPAGTMQYSMVSTTVNGKTCTRSTRLVAGRDGAKPQLISQSAGDGCAASAAPAAPALAVAPATAAPVRVTPVRLETPAKPAQPAHDTI